MALDADGDPFTDSNRFDSQAPFLITSDTELDQMATIQGWPGNGTVSNPYIMSDLEINGTGDTWCLHIGNTTKHLIIQDCWFHGSSLDDPRTDSPDLHINNARNIILERVTIGPSLLGGVYLEDSQNITFNNTTVTGLENGIWMERSHPITMDNLTTVNVDHTAVNMWRSNNNRILNSNIQAGKIGIYIDMSYGTIISDNAFAEVEWSSIYFRRSNGAILRGNTMVNGGMAVEWTSTLRYLDIDTSNIVHGNPIYKIMDRANYKAPQDAGQLLFYNCSDVDIVGNRFHNVSTAIMAFNCGRMDIDAITLENGKWETIQCVNVAELWITNSSIQTDGGVGILVEGRPGQNATIQNTTFHGGSYSQLFIKQHERARVNSCTFTDTGRWGIYTFDTTGVSIENNTFTGLRYGLYLSSAEGFQITNNVFSFCYDRAIRMGGGFQSYIHHNTFYRNAYNATLGTYAGTQVEQFSGNPQWHDGSEGNWWSDYTIRYPNANPVGKVWDTPYEIDGDVDRHDRYPLIHALETIPPVASAGPDQKVDEDTVVTMDGSLSTDNWEISDHTWTFETPTGPVILKGDVVSHTFDTPGIYVVTLTVTDMGGNIAWDNLTVTVNDVTPPVAVAGEDIEVDEGDEVVFNGTGSSDNVGIVNLTWSIPAGEGELLLYGTTPAHVFPVPGTYTVTLTVVDPAGLTATDSLVVAVRDATPPLADAGSDKDVEMGSVVQLDGSASLDNVGVTGFTWTFEGPDGSVELPGMTASYRFDEPGEYVVTLNVTDAEGNWDADTMTVTVLDMTPPIASAGEDITADQGNEVTLDGSGSLDNLGIVEWTWSFEVEGEEVTLEGESPVYTFDDAGVYEITLIVEDGEGNQASDTLQVTVRDTEEPVAVVQEDVKVQEGTTLQLDGTGSTDNVDITGYSWEISGPGGPMDLVGETVDHIFETPGNYTVTLTVVDAGGNSDDASFDVEVTKKQVPNGNGGNGDDDGPNFILYAIIAIVIVAVTIVLVMRMRKG
jgi:parallel beta-helix repeat protein